MLDPLILIVSELCVSAAVSPTAALTVERRIAERMAADEPIVEQGCFSMMGTENDHGVKQRLLPLTDARQAWFGMDANDGHQQKWSLLMMLLPCFCCKSCLE